MIMIHVAIFTIFCGWIMLLFLFLQIITFIQFRSEGVKNNGLDRTSDHVEK